MSALDNMLEDNVIERYDGRPDYLACCGADVEFGERKHTETCGMMEARAELSALRARVEALEVAGVALFQACADLPLPEMDRMEKEINEMSAALKA